MANVGHMKAIKARGKYFYYLRRAYRDENKKPTSENLFSFGQKEKALETLQSFLQDPAQKPENLKRYETADIEKWIAYINEKEA